MRSTVKILMILVMAWCVASKDQWWENCGTKSDHAKLVDLETSPEKPKWGQDFTVDITLDLDETVNDGVVIANMTWNRIALLPTTSFPLCTSGIPGIKCPMEQGRIHRVETVKVPSYFPKGQYDAYVVARDEKSEQLGCVHIKLELTD